MGTTTPTRKQRKKNSCGKIHVREVGTDRIERTINFTHRSLHLLEKTIDGIEDRTDLSKYWVDGRDAERWVKSVLSDQ
jgi:hypothetical protein